MGSKFKLIIFLLMSGMLCSSATACNLIKHYKVNFSAHSCIKPYKSYNYLTCHVIPVSIGDKKISIPQDFKTDLASIPRWLWPLVAPAHSKLMSASILHDYLYTDPEGFNRKEIDGIFYNVLVNSGVDKTHAYLMYSAVRLFGGSHFNYADAITTHIVKKIRTHDKNKISQKWRYSRREHSPFIAGLCAKAS